ncbi:pyrimidine reductase family protein [Leifsonia sp. NPDC058194]|uniref:pyrimidine reductase family protein n=1 Tax=Leifsonia sp. NPDC058194 TaxID=3346374 RepID=UPI0036DE3E06
MSDAAIGRLFPVPASDAAAQGALTDDELVALYDAPTRSPWVRVNFVSSVDGAATVQGLSAGLGDDADHRVFDLLRRLCDVVVVGAGTVRAEGYGPMRVDRAAQHARVAAGLAEQPVFAIVSAGLDLDPGSPIFTDAPVRPIVVTAGTSPQAKRDALGSVADVLVCGVDRVDTAAMVAALAERGLVRIHCEGGPHLFGDLIAAEAVDELCLTVSPSLVAGTASRIATGAMPTAPVGLELAHVLRSGDTLLLRYVRR